MRPTRNLTRSRTSASVVRGNVSANGRTWSTVTIRPSSCLLGRRDRDAGARGPGSFPSIPVSRPPAEVDHSVLDRDLQVDAPQSAIAVCDREYLRRILDNLIDNAFKYGRPPVRIEVTGDSGHVGFTVLDSGRGVAAEDRAKVFNRFERLDSMSGHGLGLGLSVVQGLVEAMGGDVRIEEAPGGGAAFRTLFPRPKRSMLEDALMDTVGLAAAPTSPVRSSSVS